MRLAGLFMRRRVKRALRLSSIRRGRSLSSVCTATKIGSCRDCLDRSCRRSAHHQLGIVHLDAAIEALVGSGEPHRLVEFQLNPGACLHHTEPAGQFDGRDALLDLCDEIHRAQPGRHALGQDRRWTLASGETASPLIRTSSITKRVDAMGQERKCDPIVASRSRPTRHPMCGRHPVGKDFLACHDVLVGSAHVSGFCSARTPMGFMQDQLPIKSTRSRRPGMNGFCRCRWSTAYCTTCRAGSRRLDQQL